MKAGSTTPVHLGSGSGVAGSRDGRWALGLPVEGYPIFVHPTGPGESRMLPDPEQIVYNLVGWLDATHVVGFGQKSGERSRGYVQDINGGLPRPFHARRRHRHRVPVVGAPDRARRDARHRCR